MFKFILRKKMEDAKVELKEVKNTIWGLEQSYESKEKELKDLLPTERETLAAYSKAIQEYLEAKEEFIEEAKKEMKKAEETYFDTRYQIELLNSEIETSKAYIWAWNGTKKALETQIESFNKKLKS